MDIMQDTYKAQLKSVVASFEGKKTEDFQYEPERAQAKEIMEKWLGERMPELDEKKLKAFNRRYFAKSMAELVYEDKVRPNINDFLTR